MFFQLETEVDAGTRPAIKSVHRIGDCQGPSTIAAAVYAGHLYAEQFDEKIDIDQVPYIREYIEV